MPERQKVAKFLLKKSHKLLKINIYNFSKFVSLRLCGNFKLNQFKTQMTFHHRLKEHLEKWFRLGF